MDPEKFTAEEINFVGQIFDTVKVPLLQPNGPDMHNMAQVVLRKMQLHSHVAPPVSLQNNNAKPAAV
jgi:hypothetical protein